MNCSIIKASKVLLFLKKTAELYIETRMKSSTFWLRLMGLKSNIICDIAEDLRLPGVDIGVIIFESGNSNLFVSSGFISVASSMTGTATRFTTICTPSA